MSTDGYGDRAALQADGKILVAGEFTSINGTTEPYLARLNTDGSVDSSFTPPTFTPPFRSLIVQPDGKILLLDSSSASINRLNADGSVDAGVSLNSNNISDPIALQTNGKILCTDYFIINAQMQAEAGLIRLNADGTADTGFRGIIYHDGVPLAIMEQPDGKIVVVGDFASVNNGTHADVVRLNADGTVDGSFNAPLLPSGAEFYAVALQPDGKILIGGTLGSADGTAAPSVARLNADGSLDASFTIGAFSGDLVTAITVQPDGKVLAAAATNQVEVQEYYMLDRFNSHPDLFSGEAALSGGIYYLAFHDGNPFDITLT